jgi:hypothetical protein
MDAKMNAKTHLEKPFFVFSSRSVGVWRKSLQNVQI